MKKSDRRLPITEAQAEAMARILTNLRVHQVDRWDSPELKASNLDLAANEIRTRSPHALGLVRVLGHYHWAVEGNKTHRKLARRVQDTLGMADSRLLAPAVGRLAQFMLDASHRKGVVTILQGLVKEGGTTRVSLVNLDILGVFGIPVEIRVHWSTQEWFKVRVAWEDRNGEEVSHVFTGFSWGYFGEGPRGLEEALKAWGAPEAVVRSVFQTAPMNGSATLDHALLDRDGWRTFPVAVDVPSVE